MLTTRVPESATMRLQPLGDKIIVKRMEASETTAGGIVLPDSARERPQQGRVLSVGNGRRLLDGTFVPPQVQEGDRVVFANYSGAPVVVEKEELLILREEEILAVLE
jgi:chaperonin GroES